MSWNDPHRLAPLFVIRCGKKWEDLEPDPERPDRRRCADCERHVYRAGDERTFDTLRSNGACVHVADTGLTGMAPPLSLRDLPPGEPEVLPPHLDRELREIFARKRPADLSDELLEHLRQRQIEREARCASEARARTARRRRAALAALVGVLAVVLACELVWLAWLAVR